MTDLKINDLDYSAKFCIMRIPKSPKFIVDGGFYDSASGYDMECVMVTGKNKTGTPDILYTSDKCPLVVKEFPHYNENCVVLVFPEDCKFKSFKVDVEHLLIPVMEELGGLWISKKHIVTFKDTDFLFYYTDCWAGSW